MNWGISFLGVLFNKPSEIITRKPLRPMLVYKKYYIGVYTCSSAQTSSPIA